MMIKVSVIVPTYKPNEYLFECINCLLYQTMEHSLFEIIIVLNGPQSPYYKQIKDFIQKVNSISIKLVYIEKNSVSIARNRGLDIAVGEHIAFIDDDDLVSKNYIESLLSNSRVNSIVCSNVRTFKNGVNNFGVDYLSLAYQRSKHINKTNILFYRSFLSTACAKLIPMEVLKGRRFNTAFNIGEDSLFMALISDRIKSIELASEDTIYYRRIRDGSLSRRKNSFFFEAKNSLILIREYCKVFFNSPFRYNLLFFITRVLATIRSGPSLRFWH